MTNGTVNSVPEIGKEGDNVSLTVTPNAGYLLDTLTVKNKDTDISVETTIDENGKYCFIAPASDVTVNATFIECTHSGVTPTYAPNTKDSSKHDVTYSCCRAVVSEDHTFDTNGGCICGKLLPVASVTIGETTTEYTSFAAAINAANSANTDCTIKLLRDTNETGTELFYIGKNGQLTVDFGTYTLTCDEFKSGTTSSMKLTGTTGGVNGNITFKGPSRGLNDSSRNLPDSCIESGVYHGTVTSHLLGDVVINGGTFTSAGKLLVADNHARLEIKNGTFTGTVGIYSSASSLIYIRSGTFTLTDDSKTLLNATGGGYIQVDGGTFTAAMDIAADSQSEVSLCGGTFKDGLKVRTTDLKSSLASGKQYWLGGVPQILSDRQTAITGGDVTLGEKVAASVTSSGTTTYYPTFESALAVFNTSGGTLTLLDDVSVGEEIKFTASGILDLNRFEFSCGGQSIVIGDGTKSNSLTIRDSSEAKTGKVTDQVLNYSQGTLTIESGSYGIVGTAGTGSVVINGGSFDGGSYDLYCSVNGKITLNGGTFQNGVALNTNSAHGQTVMTILGSGKAYKAGDTYYLKTDLANETSLGAGKTVTVVPEQDGVVATVTYNGTEYKFSSLAKAVAYEGSINMGSDDFVTLHQDTDENIEITSDIHIDFNGKKASGVFTFNGGEIYIDGAFKAGTTLSVKKNGYSTDSSSDNVVIWGFNSVGLTTDNLQPVDAGVKVKVWGGGLALVHEHEWIYVLEDTQNGQMISVSCKHLASCPYAGSSNALGAWVELKDTERYYSGIKYSAFLSRGINSYLYTDDVPNSDDVVYYDADGTQLDGEPVNAGTYTAKLTFGDKTAVVTLTIKPRSITVTADDKQKTYGDADPTLTYTVSEETPLCKNDTLTGTLTRETGEDADTYAIGQGTLTNANNPNYDITFVDGELTIGPKEITVTADDKQKTYGNEDPVLTYEVVGLVNGDKLSGALSREAGTDVGTYAITQGTLTAGSNYSISYIGASLTIHQKELIIYAKDQTITYGSTISSTAITSEGLVDGHSATATLTPSTANVTVSGTITASNAVITANGTDVTANYSILLMPGTLVIEPDTSKIDGLTTENVTSANEEDIKAIQAMMASAETDGIDEATAEQWAAITANCEDLTQKIEAVEAENARIADAAADYDLNTVKSSDEAAITALIADIDEQLATNNLTDEERSELGNLKTKCNNLIARIDGTETLIGQLDKTVDDLDAKTIKSTDKAALEQVIADAQTLIDSGNVTEAEKEALHETQEDAKALIKVIDDTAAENKALTDQAAAFDEDTVKSTDKTVLEQLAQDIEDLLDTQNLTEDERTSLEAVLSQVEGMIATINETAEDSKAATDAIEALDPATVTSDDKEELEQAIATIDELLKDDHLTEEERSALEDAKADAEALIDVIEAAQDATNTENTDKVENVTAENVKPEDKEALEDAKADLEKALEDNAGNYTEEEKQAIQDEIQRIEDAMVALENVEDVTEAIKALPETVEPDDEETAEKILDAKKAYDELTDHEKSLVDEDTKKKMDDLVADLTAYDIVTGDGGKWTKGSNYGLSFTANGPLRKFVGIEVDGKEVASTYYTAESGSTVITLKQSFLKGLSTGEHTITVLYTDGETSSTFTILEQSTTPATGNDSNIFLWSGMLCVSTLDLVVLLADRKRRKATK